MTDAFQGKLTYHAAFVAIAAVEFSTVVSFYQKLLGQLPRPFEKNRYAEFHLSGLRLGIFRPQPSHQSEFMGHSSGPISLCLEVGDLEQAIAHTFASGGTCADYITSASHGREVYAYDPAGNRIILHEAKL